MTASPKRTCVACRTQRSPDALLRYSRRRDGEVVPCVAPGRHPSGRSAYVCPDLLCMERAVTRRGLTRSLGARGLTMHAINDTQGLLEATDRALEHAIDTLTRSGAAQSSSGRTRLPQLQSHRRALRPARSA